MGPASDGAFGALLLGDARLPVGGHTQSAGLEPAILAGLRARDVPGYLRVRLMTVSRVDAATLALGMRALRGADYGLDLVHAHWSARTPSHVQRRAAEHASHGYLRLAKRLDPRRSAAAGVPATRPLAMALLADILACDPLEAVRVLLHDEIQTITSAALKLLPLDPVTSVEWAIAAHPLAETIAAEAAAVSHPRDIPSPSAPETEAWIHAHATTPRRLFSA